MNEDTTTPETVDMAPVEVVIKKKRQSKTWLALVNNGTEEYTMKVTGVTSEAEALAKIGDAVTVLSIKPARKFK